MKPSSSKQILSLIQKLGSATPGEMSRELGISTQAVHRQLLKLIDSGGIKKQGAPPFTAYTLKEDSKIFSTNIPEELEETINRHFCYFLPSGEELSGALGFNTFLKNTKQDQDVIGRVKEYITIIETAEAFRDKSSLIDGTKKLHTTFSKSVVEKLYYSDFYGLPKYGKTRLGQYLLHGKTGQSKRLIKEIANKTKAHISEIIKRHRIQALSFAPHSIPRKISFLKEYERLLDLGFPTIKLVKLFSGDVPIAQKSLSKLTERVENAEKTIFVRDSHLSKYKRILLIDDAVGSGATINQTALKLSTFGATVFGYAIVGSYKGFEVIKEV